MGQGAALAPGTIFANEYRILRPLASGGMGSVFVAEQMSTGKQRALKLMHAELAWDARLRERFVQEARVGAQIDSEHVVEVVGAGVDAASGMPWLAMELLDGVDLAALVGQRGALPPSEVREILGQLCHALAAAHRAGIVHRDLKPQNVFVARSRQQNVMLKVKVLDFGIAKVVAAARGTSSATSVVGTPLWMAPEQSDPNGCVSPATDVWALGLIAFRMLTARFYWMQAVGEASSVMSLMREVLFEPIVPASVRASQLGVPHPLPPGFDNWFGCCLVRDPRARFADAGQAMAALDAAVGAQRSAAMPSAVSLPNANAYAGPVQVTAGMGSATQSTGVGVPGQTPQAILDGSHPSGAMPRPLSPEKRGLAPWVWLVGSVTAVLLLAGALVVVIAVFAVGIEAAENGSTPAAATGPDVSGAYDITNGANPGGAGRYTGQVEVQRISATYQVHWLLAKGPDYRGIGLVAGDVFGVGYAQGGDYALAVYQIEGGTLRGAYTEASLPGRVGTEVLDGPPGLSGRYVVSESSDDLIGEVTIQPRGSAFGLSRSSRAGGQLGTGIRYGDRLVVTWATAGMTGGVVAYGIGDRVLDGKWAPLDSKLLGTETLRTQYR